MWSKTIISKNPKCYLHMQQTKIIIINGQLVNISPYSLIILNTINTEFPFIDFWFTDQNSRALWIEDNVNIIFFIQ